MLRKLLPLIVMGIVFGFTVVANAQTDSQSSAITQFEKFVKGTNVVIVTRSYPLPDLPGGGGFRMSAKVATALGEQKKMYAVDIGGRMVDFDQLSTIQDGLDKMIRASASLSETPNFSSISYRSPFGISADYYQYLADGSDNPKWNLYLVAGVYTYQTANIEALTTFRNLIAEARQKLISLGAR